MSEDNSKLGGVLGFVSMLLAAAVTLLIISIKGHGNLNKPCKAITRIRLQQPVYGKKYNVTLDEAYNYDTDSVYNVGDTVCFCKKR